MRGKRHSFVDLAERFEYLVNAILVFAIAIVILCAIGLLGFDIYNFMQVQFPQGIGTILASLLILWVLLELLATQIDFLKGGRPSITVFVVVALVAFVRKLMVASLNSDKMESACFYLGATQTAGFLLRQLPLRDGTGGEGFFAAEDFVGRVSLRSRKVLELIEEGDSDEH